MTDQKRAEMALQTLAAKDGLTELANRRCFDQALQAERLRAQRAGKPMALLFVDVDRVKPFNDRHGHQSGDECLRAIAAIVGARASRPVDLAARYGGEEFAIILPATDRDGACKVAEQIRKRRDGVADRAPRAWAQRAGDAQCRRGDARSRQRCKPRLAARTSGSGALCRQAPRPKPRRLRRHHAGRFRQAQPAQDRGAICTAQGAAIRLKQKYRTSATFSTVRPVQPTLSHGPPQAYKRRTVRRAPDTIAFQRLVNVRNRCLGSTSRSRSIATVSHGRPNPYIGQILDTSTGDEVQDI